jgi:hypothetical protein
MKKIVSLILSIAFIGSILVVAGCAPKQEAQQAPAMEQQAPAAEGTTMPAEAMPAEQAPAQ